MISSVLLLMLMQSGAQCARRFRGGRNPQPRRAPPPPTYRADRGDTTESFPLDFTAVEENMDNFMTQVKNLAQSLYPCSAQKLDYDMKLNFLGNTSVTCNDGSAAGYVPWEYTCTVWSTGQSRFSWAAIVISLQQGAPRPAGHPATQSNPHVSGPRATMLVWLQSVRKRRKISGCPHWIKYWNALNGIKKRKEKEKKRSMGTLWKVLSVLGQNKVQSGEDRQLLCVSEAWNLRIATWPMLHFLCFKLECRICSAESLDSSFQTPAHRSLSLWWLHPVGTLYWNVTVQPSNSMFSWCRWLRGV